MIVVREVVTVLRHQWDASGLDAHRQAFQDMLQEMVRTSVQAIGAMGQAFANILAGVAAPPQAAAARTPPRPQGVAAARQHAVVLGGLRGAIKLTLGAEPLKRVLADIDAWTQTQGRLRQAAGSDAQAATVDGELARASRISRTPYADNVDTYARATQTLQDHGRDRHEAVGIAEAVALSMTLSRTPAKERDGVVTSLLTMVEQGKLGMAQFNAMPQRMQEALATGLNLDRGELREQVQNGQLTTERALPALQSQLPAMRAQAQEEPASIAAAMTVFNDALQRYVGQALPLGQAALKAVTGTILYLADNIDSIVKLLALAGASLGMVALGNSLRQATQFSRDLIRSLVVATRVARGLDSAMALRRGPGGAMQMLSVWTRTLRPMLRMAALLATIFVIGQDIATWMAGGDSVLGGWIGGVEEWQDELDAVSSVLIYVKDLLGGAGQALGPWVQRFATLAVLGYGLWQVLSPVGKLILFLARTVVPMLWNAFAMTPIGRIISLIGLAATALWQIWENWDAIKAYMSASWDALMEMADASFLGPVLDYIRAIWAFWTELVAGVVSAFTGDWDGAIEHWAGAFGNLWTFFSGMGARMIATIKEIGAAIQTWVLDKVQRAKDWFKSLLPGGSDAEDDAQASDVDAKPQSLGWESMSPELLAVLRGGKVPVPPPAVLFGPALNAGRGPFTYQNRNEITVNAPGGEPQAVRAAVAQGVDLGLQRNLNSLQHSFDISPAVEAPS